MLAVLLFLILIRKTKMNINNKLVPAFFNEKENGMLLIQPSKLENLSN